MERVLSMGNVAFNWENIVIRIQKYGWDNFVHYILDVVETQEEANKMELNFIKNFNATNNSLAYNLAEGGGNFTSEMWKDPVFKQKMSESFKKARKKTWQDSDIALKLQENMQKGV